MLAAVTSALGTVISWVSTTVNALTAQAGELGELLPLFAVGIAISALSFGIGMSATCSEKNPQNSAPCLAN